jgi:hypothetical protein
VDVAADGTFRRDATGALGGLDDALLHEDLGGLGDVAGGLFERLLAVHHAGARLLTKAETSEAEMAMGNSLEVG